MACAIRPNSTNTAWRNASFRGNVADEPRYTLRKTLVGHPHQDCVLRRTQVEAAPDALKRLQLYVLCAPHVEIGGWHNNAEVVETKAGRVLVAFKGGTYMAR